jgi:hypothetical protein
MPRTYNRRELRNVEPRSLEALPPAIMGPDDEPIETEDLANHFLMEVTQSSHPQAVLVAELDHTDDSLFDGDALLDTCLAESYFDANKPDVRGFERMWNEILQRELAAEDERRLGVIPR